MGIWTKPFEIWQPRPVDPNQQGTPERCYVLVKKLKSSEMWLAKSSSRLMAGVIPSLSDVQFISIYFHSHEIHMFSSAFSQVFPGFPSPWLISWSEVTQAGFSVRAFGWPTGPEVEGCFHRRGTPKWLVYDGKSDDMTFKWVISGYHNLMKPPFNIVYRYKQDANTMILKVNVYPKNHNVKNNESVTIMNHICMW